VSRAGCRVIDAPDLMHADGDVSGAPAATVNSAPPPSGRLAVRNNCLAKICLGPRFERFQPMSLVGMVRFKYSGCSHTSLM